MRIYYLCEKFLINNRMKTKLLLALSFLLSLSGSIYAQKNVNVDNLRFSYWERIMPKTPLEPAFFYYGAKIEMPASVKNKVDESSLYENLNISGQRYTEDLKEDDVFVNVTMAPINIVSSSVKERTVESKDKAGKVTREYYYWVEVVYTFDAKAVANKSGKAIGQYTMYSRLKSLSFTSGEYGTRKGASDYWNNNREMLVEQFTRDCANSAISSLSSSLSAGFGFPIVRESGLIKTINEKKHPENDALRAKSEELKTKMEALNGKIPLTEEDVAELIEYFKNIPVRYTDTKEKADVRLRYVAYYNLCRLYLYIDQPEKVKEWADLLFANGHDKKDAERLIKDAEELKTRLDNAIIKATQFETDSFFSE
jgi:hypothetical protein